MNYLLITEKSWHDELFKQLKLRRGECWQRINKKEDFTIENLDRLKPNRIFIPHWSYIISHEIYDNFECIVFHMTDLPYGRGGSPLQNLIVRGHKETKVSAIRVTKGIDTGKIYLKHPLSLLGSASEIFIRSSMVVHKMICEIIDNDPKAIDQEGPVVEFVRRKPQDGNLQELDEIEKVFDYIRMLDCDGYPPSYLETESFRFEFINASFNEVEITANVRITKK